MDLLVQNYKYHKIYFTSSQKRGSLIHNVVFLGFHYELQEQFLMRRTHRRVGRLCQQLQRLCCIEGEFRANPFSDHHALLKGK